MWRKVRNGFFTGIALLLPIVLTVIVIRWAIAKLNILLLEPLASLFQPFIPYEFTFLIIFIKILLFFLIILIISSIGLTANTLVMRRLFFFGENLLTKVPFVNKVYITIKQISSAFLGKKRHIFQEVVLVEYPRKGLYCIGFITSPVQEKIYSKVCKTDRDEVIKTSLSNAVNVFIPTTPNPTSGFLLFVPKSELIPLDISVEEGMKLVISGGVV